MNKKIAVFILLAAVLQINAWSLSPKTIYNIAKIFDNSHTFPNVKIKSLSQLSAKELGSKLGKLKLSDEILEDTFIRIAVHKKIIHRKQAQGMFAKLSGVAGFRTTLKKIIGNNPAGTKGHLNELQIANNASVAGFKVLGIGEKFKDPAKKALTDIDIVLKKGHRTFIIEAKAYHKTKIDKINYKADLNTLTAYQKQHKNSDITAVFSFTEKPSDLAYFKFLNNEAKKSGVQLIFGNASEQIEKIKMLDEIL